MEPAPPKPKIEAEDLLHRRITNYGIVREGDKCRLSSSAFVFDVLSEEEEENLPPEERILPEYQPTKREPNISVNLAKETNENDSVQDRNVYGLAGVLVKVPRDLGLAVEYRPTQANPAHSQIETPITIPSQNKKKAKEIAKRAQILIEPPKPPETQP